MNPSRSGAGRTRRHPGAGALPGTRRGRAATGVAEIETIFEGGSGPSFDYETSAPYSNSVFGGAGISAKIGDRWSASVFYNVNFGAEGYTNNIISTSLGFSF